MTVDDVLIIFIALGLDCSGPIGCERVYELFILIAVVGVLVNTTGTIVFACTYYYPGKLTNRPDQQALKIRGLGILTGDIHSRVPYSHSTHLSPKIGP